MSSLRNGDLRRNPENEGQSVYLGLGSNLGDRLANLRTALSLMEAAGIRVIKASSLYETEPVGPAQPDFLNAVCRVRTDLPPHGLLAALKRIEEQVGRVPRERWGPREVDLDILLYGTLTVDKPDLTVPHRELLNRPFVLIPLHEIAPELILPSGEPLEALVPQEASGVRRCESQSL